MRERPRPPHPDLVRRPTGSFGWLDARLLHERWLAALGPEATAVLTLLALAADEHGASHWSRARMTQALPLGRKALDQALLRVQAHGLLAHRPWRPGHPDGVWQLLPVPPRLNPGANQPDRADRPAREASLGDILRHLEPENG